MAGAAKGEKEEKPVPVKCVCGADAAYVKFFSAQSAADGIQVLTQQ
jgi:hypothetical protein